MRHFLLVIGQPKHPHAVNEEGGQIEPPAILTCGVITREDMMVVVVSLANCTEGDKEIFSWVDVLVIWLVAIEMSPTVDEPGYIQSYDVTE